MRWAGEPALLGESLEFGVAHAEDGFGVNLPTASLGAGEGGANKLGAFIRLALAGAVGLLGFAALGRDAQSFTDLGQPFFAKFKLSLLNAVLHGGKGVLPPFSVGLHSSERLVGFAYWLCSLVLLARGATGGHD